MAAREQRLWTYYVRTLGTYLLTTFYLRPSFLFAAITRNKSQVPVASPPSCTPTYLLPVTRNPPLTNAGTLPEMSHSKKPSGPSHGSRLAII